MMPKALYLRVSVSALAVAAEALFVAAPALAQADEIVVTARKREESLQEVPVAVTVIGEEALREKNITDPYDLTQNVPGLTVRQGEATRTSVDFFIRGQGASFGTAGGVVTYFNETPTKDIGVAGTNLQYFDLQSIQVLKGPQGTLFGRSSTGGAVLVTPRKPSNEFGGYVDAKAGNLNMYEVTAAVNIPIWEDKLAVRGAFNLVRQTGFTKSLNTDQNLDSRHREAYRIGVNFTPIDWFENYTLFQMNNVNENPTGAVLIDFNENSPLLNPAFAPLVLAPLCGAFPLAAQASCFADRTQRLTDLRTALDTELARVRAGGSIRENQTAQLNYLRARDQQISNITQFHLGEVGPFGDITLKNIFSTHRNRKSAIIREFGASPVPHGVVVNNHDLQGFPAMPVALESDGRSSFGDDIVEEFQILGDIDGTFNYIVGFFTERVSNPNFPPPPVFISFNNAFTVPLDNLNFLSNTTTQTKNVQTGYFGQFTADLSSLITDGLSLTGGFRWTESSSRTDSFALIPSPAGRSVGPFLQTVAFSESAPSWSVSLDYQASDDILVYAAHRRGFKPGGVNGVAVGAAIPGVNLTFGPETLDDIELGLKSGWSAGDVQGVTNIAVFYGWYGGVQRTLSISDGMGGVVTPTGNVAAATIKGLEMESQMSLTENFQVNLTYAFTDAEYTEFPGMTTTIFGQMIPSINTPFSGVAKHQGSIGVRYTFPFDPNFGEVSLYGEYYRQSGVWLDDDSLVSFPRTFGFQEGYDNLNARLDWNNIGGSPVDGSLFVRNAFDDVWKVGANSLINAIGIHTSTYNEPRTFGAQLRVRFGADAN